MVISGIEKFVVNSHLEWVRIRKNISPWYVKGTCRYLEKGLKRLNEALKEISLHCKTFFILNLCFFK